MKKFIIAICGVMLACGAMGEPSRYGKPKKYSSTSGGDVWKSGGYSTSYTTPLDSVLYHDLADQMSKISPDIHGTWNDEGAIVLIVARDIYDNGGNFCMTQIQAANENGTRYTWLDYYQYPGKYDCEVLCREDFWGAGCKKTGKPGCSSVGEINFGVYEKKTSGKDEHKITDKIQTFLAYNSEGESDTTATHRLLVVTKKMNHGVIVSPVEIIGERYQSGTWDGKYSYIKSVHSNGQKFLLCAENYEPNDKGDDCELSSWCGGNIKVCSDENRTFDESKHEWDTKLEDGKICKFIVCKSGYGLKEDGQTCISCETTRTQGVKSNGECKQCDDNQIFKDGDCRDYKTTLKAQDLVKGIQRKFDCWMEMGGDAYRTCVNCPENRIYDKSTKTCK